MDAHLRSLERAAALGDPDARAQYLCERRRTGKLTTDRLRLAAYAGDPAARAALGPHAPREALDLGTWGQGIAACGREAAVRALLALADLASLELERTPSSTSPWESLRGIAEEGRAALARWVREPHDGTRRVVIRLGEDLADARQGLQAPHLPRERLVAAARAAVHYAGHVVGSNAIEQLVDIAANGMTAAGRSLIEADVPEARVRETVRDAITPWALGERDPLG